MSRVQFVTVILAALLSANRALHAEEGEWKTAYVKRGFVGPADAAWVGGVGSTQRMRTPLPFDGTKVRVYVRGTFEHDVELTKMALIKGADDKGKITGKPFPILFRGSPTLKIEKKLKTDKSDEISIPITRGTWYIEDQYASRNFPYAYEVDRGYFEPGDAFTKETFAKSAIMRTGIAYRVDVFTTDRRPTILCYGDSITHGFGSTPNADHRYPSILGKLLDRPVLNLGQNSDTASQARNVPNAAKELPGVDTVIFLMGINDIVLGSTINSAKAYADVVQQIINGCHQHKIKIYIGTLTPASSLPAFAKKAGHEKLRSEINAWITQGNGADGVIDFAAALADPTDATKLKKDYDSDGIHPNDLGYKTMAEAAEMVLKGK
jgi:lysophospholipase L1-like esterase